MKKISETTKTSGKRLVFFGNERIATGVHTTAPTLQALLEAGYDIAAVISNYEKGVSRNARPLEVQAVAESNNIPLLLPDRPSSIIDQIRGFHADAAILIAYGKIVPQSVIDLFPIGIINVHPSLLPLHRGPTPIESVILSGEDKTGVSIMKLSKEMDAGPVYGQSEVRLRGTETKQELADTLLELGKSMLIELLPGILDGSIIALPQTENRATYDRLIEKEAGVIDWTKPAQQIDREIRAFTGWPRSRTTLGGVDVIITDAHVISDKKSDNKPGDMEIIKETGSIVMTTGNGKLSIEKLIPTGKKEMPVKAFLAGYGSRLV